jgi:hypothetical protein
MTQSINLSLSVTFHEFANITGFCFNTSNMDAFLPREEVADKCAVWFKVACIVEVAAATTEEHPYCTDLQSLYLH